MVSHDFVQWSGPPGPPEAGGGPVSQSTSPSSAPKVNASASGQKDYFSPAVGRKLDKIQRRKDETRSAGTLRGLAGGGVGAFT